MKKTNDLGQSGMVSILVTMIMLIVITLIVLGFGQVARHNQREVLDRQLSTQAFYAAETGVNDVLTLVGSGGYSPSADITDYESCDSANATTNFINKYSLGAQSVLNSAANIKYTCLLVTPHVPSIVQTVSLGDSKVVPINPTNASGTPTATDLTFSWQAADNSTTANGSQCPNTTSGNSPASFVPTNQWNSAPCDFGILRLDLFDVSTNPTTPAAMNSKTAAIYFVPTISTSPVATLKFGENAAANGANVIKAKCVNGSCTATIKAGAFGSSTHLYARESAIYASLNQVTINGAPNVTFSGAELLIDATGRAQDQLKRIQVRVNLNGTSEDSAPSNALQSGTTLCKRFKTLGSGNAIPDFNAPTPLCN